MMSRLQGWNLSINRFAGDSRTHNKDPFACPKKIDNAAILLFTVCNPLTLDFYGINSKKLLAPPLLLHHNIVGGSK